MDKAKFNKLNESIGFLKTCFASKQIQPLLDLAEAYLSASGEMPELPEVKYEDIGDDFGSYDLYYYDVEHIKRYKDDCTLVLMKQKEQFQQSPEVQAYIEACIQAGIDKYKDTLQDVIDTAVDQAKEKWEAINDMELRKEDWKEYAKKLEKEINTDYIRRDKLPSVEELIDIMDIVRMKLIDKRNPFLEEYATEISQRIEG